MRKQFLLFSLLTAVCLPYCFSQGLTSVSGAVSDPSGAVVPGAQLILENVETGAKREMTSDATGNYSFPQVQPGNFRISAKAPGFSDVIVNNVRLLVNTPATVNVTFEKVGTTTEVISVTADAIQVNTTDASLGNAIGTRPITELPLFARNPAALLSYQPGVTNFGTGSTDNVGADPGAGTATSSIDDRNGSVNGGKSDQGNITLDGVDINDQQTRRAFKGALRMTLDSVQEFRTTTLNATADQGRTSGAQIALVTRSGTNELHGAVWEYHRNTVTAANTFFNNASGVKRPALLINVFGGRIGGPIVRNRLFFFGNYEGRRDASSSNAQRTVPSELLKQGIVQYQRTGGGIGQLSPDDLRTRIDPNGVGVNQAALQLLRTYPAGNDSTLGDGLNLIGYRFTAPNKTKFDTYISKFDWAVDPANTHQVFLRAQLQNDRSTGVPQFPGDPPSGVGLDNSKGLATGLTSVLTPNFISTFRYGFTRQGSESTGVQTASAVTFRNLGARFPLTRGRTRIIPVHHVAQDFSYHRGNHDIRLGGTLRWTTNRSRNFENSFHGVSGNLSWLRGTGSEFETNLPDLSSGYRSAYGDAVMIALGVLSQGTAQYNYDIQGNVIPVGEPILRNFKNEEYEWYVQDTWKVTRSLTITAGLRHSLMPPVYEANGVQTSANISFGEWFNRRGGLAQEGKSQKEAGLISFDLASSANGRSLYDFHKKNFAPRFSIAYSPQGSGGLSRFLFGGPGRSSIRAGFGMFYDLFGQGIIRAMDSRQFGLSSSLTNPASSLTAATAPRFTGFNNIPGELIRPAPSLRLPALYPASGAGSFAITNSIDDTLRPPYNMALNFTVQREFGAGLLVQGSYVGRLSRRSLVSRDLAMPTDIKDPASGATWYEAASQMARLSRSRVPANQVQKIPYFENLWPNLATATLTATQAVYNVFRLYPNDETGALSDLDHYEDPACSRLGCNAFFSSQFSALAGMSSIGGGNYHAMQWTVRKRYSAGLEFDVNYTWSKSVDLSSDSEYALWAGPLTIGYNGFLVNPWQPGLSKGVSDYDATHIVNGWAVWDLPFGRGKKWGSGVNGLVNQFIGGWTIAPVYGMSSGLPFSIGNGRYWPTNWNITGLGTNISPVATSVGVTKNAPAITGAGGPNVFGDPNVAIKSFDYTLPGGAGDRNNLRGDGRFSIDLNVAKRFVITERHAVQLRWETYNLTNTVRFNTASVNTSLTNTGTFGKYTNSLGGPRQMQFALRYEF